MKIFSQDAISKTRKVLARKYDVLDIENVSDADINALLNVGLDYIRESEKFLSEVFKRRYEHDFYAEKFFELANGVLVLRKASYGSEQKKFIQQRPSVKVIEYILKKAIQGYEGK